MRPLPAEYGKLHSRIEHLYDCDCPDCAGRRTALKQDENGDKIAFEVFRRAYRRVFGRRGMSPEMLSERPIASAIEATAAVLREAAAPALESAVVPPEMRRALSEDIFVFSGFKTYHNLKEASALLLDEDGKVKPFSRYLQDVRAIHERYNRSYLEAEYLFATQSARMADKWQEHAQDEDRYNLQYRTAGDARVRQEHQALDLVTLPASDPFWAEYYPPNGWRCRCNVVRVRKGKYEESDSDRAVEAGRAATEDKLRIFRFNPGRQKVIFPPHHPYYGRQGYGHCLNPHLAADMGGNEVCKVLAEVMRAKENPRNMTFKEIDKEIKTWAKENGGFRRSDAYRSGALRITKDTAKRYLSHARSAEEKWLLADIEENPQRLRFVRFDVLGDNKDMSIPKDKKNIEGKARRGVIGYNVYDYEKDGKTYRVGFEVVEKEAGSWEQPYYVKKKN